MPTRLTAQDFNQELLILFDAYVHGDLDRRGFLSQAQKFAKAGITTARPASATTSASSLPTGHSSTSQ